MFLDNLGRHQAEYRVLNFAWCEVQCFDAKLFAEKFS
jgi:hypothetical protein